MVESCRAGLSLPRLVLEHVHVCVLMHACVQACVCKSEWWGAQYWAAQFRFRNRIHPRASALTTGRSAEPFKARIRVSKMRRWTIKPWKTRKQLRSITALLLQAPENRGKINLVWLHHSWTIKCLPRERVGTRRKEGFLLSCSLLRMYPDPWPQVSWAWTSQGPKNANAVKRLAIQLLGWAQPLLSIASSGSLPSSFCSQCLHQCSEAMTPSFCRSDSGWFHVAPQGLGQNLHHASLVKAGPLFPRVVSLAQASCTSCSLREPHKAQCHHQLPPHHSACLLWTCPWFVSEMHRFNVLLELTDIGVRCAEFLVGCPWQNIELLESLVFSAIRRQWWQPFPYKVDAVIRGGNAGGALNSVLGPLQLLGNELLNDSIRV